MELMSLKYAVFAALTVIAYFAVHKIPKGQRTVILTANMVFIFLASGIGTLVLVVLLCLVHFLNGIAIEKRVEDGRQSAGRLHLWIGVIFAVGVLCYFKFFKETYILLQELVAAHGITFSDLITPIGISYYTLSLIAYNVDVFHKKHKAERNFADFLTFITFFPSIIQGPINLYKNTAPKLIASHEASADRIIRGLLRCLWGYIKKIVIADRIGIIVVGILGSKDAAMFTLIWAIVLYSFQIYTDFSGGIDVIMGIAEIMDIELAENFRAPFLSKSVTEFWQRWHMSLGGFMEKYVYYPIVLNRNMMKISKKIPGKYLRRCFAAAFASFVVFVIVGIWHGTGWNYVAYGCYQAFFVSTGVLMGPAYKKMKSVLHIDDKAASWRAFQILRTYFILIVSFFFIRAASLRSAIELLKRAFVGFKLSSVHVLFDGSLYEYGLDYKNMIVIYLGIVTVLVVDVINEHKIYLRDLIMKQDIVFRYIVYLSAIFVIIIFGVYGAEFDSASFIYQGF